MIKTIEFFNNATPIYLALGVIGIAVVIRVAYEIIFGK